MGGWIFLYEFSSNVRVDWLGLVVKRTVCTPPPTRLCMMGKSRMHGRICPTCVPCGHCESCSRAVAEHTRARREMAPRPGTDGVGRSCLLTGGDFPASFAQNNRFLVINSSKLPHFGGRERPPPERRPPSWCSQPNALAEGPAHVQHTSLLFDFPRAHPQLKYKAFKRSQAVTAWASTAKRSCDHFG